ncbi:NACHT, LRR and PYD domains-containing protein 12-like [Amphiura filiformis]|uniref:NACHT, LRR and PYD domains-containing protein 12-like n=1 Tax=Amphiura filiformis TaxID=82378 RepID=UPI003B21A891
MASNSNDNLMQELQERERHDVTTDEAAGNESSSTTLMPASIHGEKVSVIEQQTNVSGDQKILTGDNYQAQTMNVFVGDKGYNSRPVLSLKTIRRQLMEEYRETRSKLPLLPGMPEEFAKMEDIFVDLEIIEQDKNPSRVIGKNLKSYGDLVCIERNKENSQDNELVKRILVRGKPGIGKSTTISKLAYDWAYNKQDSPMLKFELLFVITVNEIDTDTDLIGVIQDQLLPKVSRQNLEELIQSNANSVAILFDGYDEATIHFDRCKDIKNVLCSKWLAGACVIVTTRPNLVGKFSQVYGPYLQVEIIGFSEKAREKYVNKFLRFRKNANEEKGNDENEKNVSGGVGGGGGGVGGGGVGWWWWWWWWWCCCCCWS